MLYLKYVVPFLNPNLIIHPIKAMSIFYNALIYCCQIIKKAPIIRALIFI